MRYVNPTNKHNWHIIRQDDRGKPIAWMCTAHFGVLYIVREDGKDTITCSSTSLCSMNPEGCPCASAPLGIRCPLRNADGGQYEKLFQSRSFFTSRGTALLLRRACEFAAECEGLFDKGVPPTPEVLISIPVEEILDLLTEVTSECLI